MSSVNLILIFLSLFPTLMSGCKISPSDWCESQENAKECGVYSICEKYVWKSKINQSHSSGVERSADLVTLTLYYESLCPDCKNFILKELFPVMQEVREITDLVLIPYGNALQKKVGSKWLFYCQHGPEECVGNIIQTCTIHFYPEVKTQLDFVHCMEESRDHPEVSAPKCAQEFGIDYNMVEMCANSSLGNMLEHKMGELTEALQPPHKYVPWVTLNGVHTDAIQKEAMTNLLKLLCDTYKGAVKPSACTMKMTQRENSF